MPHVVIVFWGNWDGVLPPGRRRVARRAPPRASLKDLIEAAGVPHTEVGAVEIETIPAGEAAAGLPGDATGRRAASLEELVLGDLRIRVDPVPLVAGAPADPKPRFVLDGHLGALAARLRLLGFDALYRAGATDDELARQALAEARWLLTRDRGLLKRRSLVKGCLIRADRPREQARELLDRLGLRSLARPWTRCLRCNGTLVDVPKAEILDRLPPLTRRHHDRFRRCAGCGRIYWEGTHAPRLRQMLREMGVPDAPG